MNAYYVPGTALSIVHTLTLSILTTAPQGPSRSGFCLTDLIICAMLFSPRAVPDWSQRVLVASLTKTQIHQHYADWWIHKLWEHGPEDYILNKIPDDSEQLTAVCPPLPLLLYTCFSSLDILSPKVWLKSRISKVELFLPPPRLD